MAKLTRFEKSQKAHYSLHFKHIANSIGNPYADFKADYHNDVVTIQRHAKKIIPRSERKILYKYNKQRVFASKEKPVKSSTYLGIFKKYNVNSY